MLYGTMIVYLPNINGLNFSVNVYIPGPLVCLCVKFQLPKQSGSGGEKPPFLGAPNLRPEKGGTHEASMVKKNKMLVSQQGGPRIQL